MFIFSRDGQPFNQDRHISLPPPNPDEKGENGCVALEVRSYRFKSVYRLSFRNSIQLLSQAQRENTILCHLLCTLSQWDNTEERLAIVTSGSSVVLVWNAATKDTLKIDTQLRVREASATIESALPLLAAESKE